MSLFVSTLCGKQTPMNFTGAFGFYSERNEGDAAIVQELCESRGGRPGLSVLTSLLVSMDVKIC